VVPDDVLEAARRDSARYGGGGELDYALLVDGLEAEREQGITIDVAYRYFSTPRRTFIIADTPGHEQYTRNMATGASRCQLAVILVDATRGVLPQTRRHAFIASLLGIRHLMVAVNKMDRVGFDREVFEAIRADFSDFASRLETADLRFIPVSAVGGDNVVHPSPHTPWYAGSPLLAQLETVYVASDRNLIDLRLPVQYVVRGDGRRVYCGTLASGVVRRGEEVLVLPGRRRTRVATLATPEGDAESAAAPQAVAVTLADAVDVARGDMLVPVGNVPRLESAFDAMLVWMDEQPLAPGGSYLLRQTTVQAGARVAAVRYRIDVHDLHRRPAEGLELNEIGRVRVETSRPLACDAYARNRATGSFILVDRLTHATVAAGLVLDRHGAEELEAPAVAPDAGTNVRPAGRAAAGRATRFGGPSFCVWLTGLPRSGKTSLALALEEALAARGVVACLVDGEDLRLGVSRDLGFSDRDRRENVRRAAALARMLGEGGITALVALVSPTAEDRALARRTVGGERFFEVWCSAPLAACEARDTDGLYARARAGEAVGVTGVDSPYEEPADPDLTVPTAEVDVAEAARRVVAALEERGLLA
jgi:bifunctional enzyme CysN/CysC